MNLIAKDKKGRMVHFLKDCEREGNNYIGSNGSLRGLKADAYDLVWTEEDIKIMETVTELPRGRSIRIRTFEDRQVKSEKAPKTRKERLADAVNDAKGMDELKSILGEIIGRM